MKIQKLLIFLGQGLLVLNVFPEEARKYVYENNPKTQNILYRNLSNNFDKNKYDINKNDFLIWIKLV